MFLKRIDLYNISKASIFTEIWLIPSAPYDLIVIQYNAYVLYNIIPLRVVDVTLNRDILCSLHICIPNILYFIIYIIYIYIFSEVQ